MPTLPVPLFSPVYRNVDKSMIADESYTRYNAFVDEKGNFNAFPGHTLAGNGGTSITGLYCWPERYFVATAPGQVTYLTSALGSNAFNPASPLASTVLLGNNPVTFCNDANYLVMANGASIEVRDVAGTVKAVVGAPSNVTHVAHLDGYILANGTDNRFFWCDLLNPLVWSGLNFAQAVGNPDKITALYVFNRQIFLFGATTVEIWENSADPVFSRVPGGYLEVGCAAPYSPVKLDNAIAWLNDKKQFVSFGGGLKVIDCPFAKEIYNFADVSECIGTRIDHENRTYCQWRFPNEGKTYTLDVKNEQWTELALWNSQTMTWDDTGITASAYDDKNKRTFFGTRNSGNIIGLDSAVRTDYTSVVGAQAMKVSTMTGWIDFGTSKHKRCKALRMRVKRGEANASANSMMILRWRSDGDTSWENEVEIPLGPIGKTDIIFETHRTGIFKSRQWELYATDPVDIVVGSVEQDLEVLSR